MFLPAFVSGILLGAFVPAYRDPAIRFLCKQIEILQRILRDHNIRTAVCTPDERIALLSIGQEMKHHVKSMFLINTWHTYRRWLNEQKVGKQPKRPGRYAKFTQEEVLLVLRIAKENMFFGLGRIVGEMKKLGISISASTVKAILRSHNITPVDDRRVSIDGSWQKFTANVDSLIACDFLTKTLYTLHGKFDAYVLVFIHLGTRRVWLSPATLSPNETWCRQQAINASMWIEDEGFNFRYLILDNDKKFTARFDVIFNQISDSKQPVVRTGRKCPV